MADIKSTAIVAYARNPALHTTQLSATSTKAPSGEVVKPTGN